MKKKNLTLISINIPIAHPSAKHCEGFERQYSFWKGNLDKITSFYDIQEGMIKFHKSHEYIMRITDTGENYQTDRQQ